MLVDSTAAKLVGDRFHWSPKREGFVIESNEAIRAFNMEEIGILKSLKEAGYLKQLGAFGFIVARSHEDQFFSKTDIEAVRPCEKENREFFAIATMLDYAVVQIVKEASGVLYSGKVDECQKFIEDTTEELPERKALLDGLANLKNDQGTKFGIQGKGVHAVLDFIAEVVKDKFRLWVSWSPLENSKVSDEDAIAEAARMVIGYIISKNCLESISFIPKSS